MRFFCTTDYYVRWTGTLWKPPIAVLWPFATNITSNCTHYSHPYVCSLSINWFIFVQNWINDFFVSSFPNKEKSLIWRNPYSNENKAIRVGEIKKTFIWGFEMQICVPSNGSASVNHELYSNGRTQPFPDMLRINRSYHNRLPNKPHSPYCYQLV